MKESPYLSREQLKEHNAITARLKKHKELMEKYIGEGMTKEVASARAYKEIY